jgi:hypothetical protein
LYPFANVDDKQGGQTGDVVDADKQCSNHAFNPEYWFDWFVPLSV